MNLIIETLDDVLPCLSPNSGIIHSDHGSYSVVNYVYATEDTFDSSVALECRGLKFDKSGRLIARPFHKFFNLGERRPPEDEPWHASHVVLDKLDGSMIHPALIDGEVVFMTRMGISEQARKAWDAASWSVRAFSRAMVETGFTPIFEFTSPENRIVVAYDSPKLTLLAIRCNRTGAYMSHGEMTKTAMRYSVSTASVSRSVDDVTEFWSRARSLKDVEGYVIAFDDGHRLKVKADDYVLRHKTLSGLAQEKNLLSWVAKSEIDDVIPLLSTETAHAVLDYQSQVINAVGKWETELGAFVSENASVSRKEFASKVKLQIHPRMQSVVFKARDGVPPRSGLMQILLRAASSDAKVEDIRPLFKMQWSRLA